MVLSLLIRCLHVIMNRLALFSIQQTDLTEEVLINGYVTNTNPTPTLTPNCNPNLNRNRNNKKNPKRNDFRKSIGRFAGWKIVLT
jgi:hypothetical protein